jgi:hypothetical protein
VEIWRSNEICDRKGSASSAKLALVLAERRRDSSSAAAFHQIAVLDGFVLFREARVLATDLRCRIAGGEHFSQSKKVNLAPGNRILSCFG